MKRWLAGIVVLVAVAAAAWFGRDHLKARYYVHRLLAAADAEAAEWIEQAATWGDGVPGRLIDCLATDDAAACTRAGAALSRMAAAGRTAAIVGPLADGFTGFSSPGRRTAIECVADWAAGSQPEVIAACRRIVRPALHDSDDVVRLRAATLALRPEVGQADLLLPLLNDPDAEVRRTALLAVGPERSLMADDDLLRWLHDPDAEVRRLTDTALRSRGLQSRDIRMGRLLTDPRPAARLDLVNLLRDDGDLDLSAWLRRLSEDPVPAVRAAAARLAEERDVFQLTERLAQMAKADPDLTVRQAVAYHLRQLQIPERPASAP
jgi:hypothetical protein